ncbi:MAG: bifunctional DNA primase/polymerase [Chloroflexi bacterium]|nr:bifunctional DNA primase/polymerase [Chloroflexota bacterium]
MSEQLLTAALRYLDAGLSVIPIGGDKRPLMALLPREPNQNGRSKPTWKPFREQRPDRAALTRWFGQEKANVAIVTGQVSGGLVVFDFDTDADLYYRRWRRLVGPLARKLPLAATGKGYHVYVRTDVSFPNRKLTYNKEKRVLIETRGEGGYIIAPPSLHPNGRRYQWCQGGYRIPQVTDAAFELLVASALELDEREKEKEQSNGQSVVISPPVGLTSVGDIPIEEERLRRYALAAVRGEADVLAATVPGSRNDALNLAAFRLGRFISAGLLTPAEVEAALEAACGAVGNGYIPDDGPISFRSTLASGVQAGSHVTGFREHLSQRLAG